MAIINKTGITTGGTIQAEHVTRAIDALSGGSTDSVVATGSFTGSFTGPLNGLAVQASQVNTAAGTDNSTHYVLFGGATSGQQAPSTDTSLTFNPVSNALTLTGSLTTSGSLNMTATPASVVNLSAISSSGNFAIPLVQPTNPVAGSMYVSFLEAKLYLYDGSTWQAIGY